MRREGGIPVTRRRHFPGLFFSFILYLWFHTPDTFAKPRPQSARVDYIQHVTRSMKGYSARRSDSGYYVKDVLETLYFLVKPRKQLLKNVDKYWREAGELVPTITDNVKLTVMDESSSTRGFSFLHGAATLILMFPYPSPETANPRCQHAHG